MRSNRLLNIVAYSLNTGCRSLVYYLWSGSIYYTINVEHRDFLMKNNLQTPYSLSLQSVLNEFSKYALKLGDAKELGIRHEPGAKVNSSGLALATELKSIVVAPEFNHFVKGLPIETLKGEVVLARPHGVGLTLSTHATAYEFASMSLFFSNYCLMLESSSQPNTTLHRTFGFLKNLSNKIHAICSKIIGFIEGSNANIMSHFMNSVSHEIDTRGTFNGSGQ